MLEGDIEYYEYFLFLELKVEQITIELFSARRVNVERRSSNGKGNLKDLLIFSRLWKVNQEVIVNE